MIQSAGNLILRLRKVGAKSKVRAGKVGARLGQGLDKKQAWGKLAALITQAKYQTAKVRNETVDKVGSTWLKKTLGKGKGQMEFSKYWLR